MQSLQQSSLRWLSPWREVIDMSNLIVLANNVGTNVHFSSGKDAGRINQRDLNQQVLFYLRCQSFRECGSADCGSYSKNRGSWEWKPQEKSSDISAQKPFKDDGLFLQIEIFALRGGSPIRNQWHLSRQIWTLCLLNKLGRW